MSILEKIVAQKKKEVAERISLYPVKLLEQSIYFGSEPISMKKYLLREDKSGIIAEIKRKSPSKGLINSFVNVERTSIGYMQAGASALSILTDSEFFGGKNEDLTAARKYNFCPILRKDFILEEYQIVESKSIGADTILLIAACLEPQKIKQLAEFAKSLGMEVLLEVHNDDELQRSINPAIDMVGVNNRNLATFETNVQTSKDLATKIPADFVKVSESGISDPKTVAELKTYGYQGFLIGEYFMQHANPEDAASRFVRELKKTDQPALQS